MKILFLTFYFEPDLCAGSFRNTSLFNELAKQLTENDSIEVITTHPNRYSTYNVAAEDLEKRGDNIIINRIKIPKHNSGLLGQINSFTVFYKEALKIAKNGNYDLVYASSSRLFTAFLGSRISRKQQAKLYLDIRDLFRESIVDIFKNSFIKVGLNNMLKPIEQYTFKKADHINLVSEGFRSYFKKFNNCSYSYNTNGIDDVFLEQRKINNVTEKKKLKTILYAGNIGEGQGLHIIIPLVAKALNNQFVFKIIGDGGAKQKLVDHLRIHKISNVEILTPVNRAILIEEYKKADFLFLHLNKYKAFERVLPSKLFEYGVFDKPIIAGVSGYAAKFINEHVANTILFEPGDVKSLIAKMNEYEYINVNRVDFIQKFTRHTINSKMANSIISIGNE